MSQSLTLNGMEISLDGERNLLEVARKAGVELPTFCYHSELSIYGACRLCIVDIEGMGIVASCSVVPTPGMVVRTQTEELRRMRRMTLELYLANHHSDCPTCPRNASCKLQDLAQRLGVREVRLRQLNAPRPIDDSSEALLMDPNKCVRCGDCVRTCAEIQGVGAIDFINRGHEVRVAAAFGEGLGDGECVRCGQCAAVCPVGAITVRPEQAEVWAALDDPRKTVIAAIAPAVRVGIGERFGMAPGEIATGRLVAALRRLGFDKVYDAAFAADLTVIEEAEELMERVQSGARLPQFTSCCPAWVRAAEQYHPELLDNLSTCRSPQQMFGSVARRALPKKLGVAPEDLVVVSIMPCTAKKSEARLDRFKRDGRPDVDHVLTTVEVGRMIEEAGLRFLELPPESLDLPLGFKTGAGVIFGASGGVSEAALRYAVEKLEGSRLEGVDFQCVRGFEGLREAEVEAGGLTLKLAVVHGLAKAAELAEAIKAGERDYHFVEVMACPGGCVGGAGQPVATEPEVRQARARGLLNADKMLQLHKSQENPMLAALYAEHIGEVGGEVAHDLLHTRYHNRRRVRDERISLLTSSGGEALEVQVCVGTNCHLRASQDLLQSLLLHVERAGLVGLVNVGASFCFERCDRGPSVTVGDEVIERCTLDKAVAAIEARLASTARAPMMTP